MVSQDHYGRTLAHVFSGARPAGAAREGSAACHLLRSGLAWRVTVPPNLRYQQDYHLAEQQARAKGAGVWSSQRQAQPWASAAGRGFRLLRATITDTEFSRDWWLKTTDDFIVRIAAEDQQYFDGAWLSALVAVEVEIRGWMYRRGGTPWGGRDGKAWVLGLKHPDSIRLLGQG